MKNEQVIERVKRNEQGGFDVWFEDEGSWLGVYLVDGRLSWTVWDPSFRRTPKSLDPAMLARRADAFIGAGI